MSQFIAPLCEESKDLLLLLFPNPEPPAVWEQKTFMGEGNHRTKKFGLVLVSDNGQVYGCV